MVRERVRAWMEAEGLTQASAAARLGVSQGAISQLLAAPRRKPALRLALAIERESATWGAGQIRTEEWLDASEAKPDAA